MLSGGLHPLDKQKEIGATSAFIAPLKTLKPSLKIGIVHKPLNELVHLFTSRWIAHF